MARDKISENIQTLLLILYQALSAEWGVKVRVASLGDESKTRARFNSLFYKARNQSPEFASLKLLTTANEGEFLIIKDKKDGERRLEEDNTSD